MSIANEFLETIARTRAPARLDELARKLWIAHGEGLIANIDAAAVSAAVEARRAVLAGGTVLEALLWAFHNAKSGVCFPSYETIAEAAHCARSTVAEAIRALEDAGILSWVHRIKRVREPCPDLLGNAGWQTRVIRSSNAYNFRDPSPSADRPRATESEKSTATATQVAFPNSSPLGNALSRLARGNGGSGAVFAPTGAQRPAAWCVNPDPQRATYTQGAK